MTKKTGKPRIDFDWKVLDSILQFGATLIDCSEMLKVSEDTIQKRIRELHDLKFSEYRNRKMSRMRVRLLQRQFDSAMSGNTALLIWLGKQHLGQSDKLDTSLDTSQIQINISKGEDNL